MPPGHNVKPLPWGLGRFFILKDIISKLFQIRRTKWLSQNFAWKCLGKWWAFGGWGNLPSDHFQLIKKAQILSIFNRMTPFWSFHDKTFYKNHICPKGITYNPCPEGYGEEVVILKGIISKPYNHVEQNCHIKMLVGNIWGNDGSWEGVILPLMTFDY